MHWRSAWVEERYVVSATVVIICASTAPACFSFPHACMQCCLQIRLPHHGYSMLCITVTARAQTTTARRLREHLLDIRCCTTICSNGFSFTALYITASRYTWLKQHIRTKSKVYYSRSGEANKLLKCSLLQMSTWLLTIAERQYHVSTYAGRSNKKVTTYVTTSRCKFFCEQVWHLSYNNFDASHVSWLFTPGKVLTPNKRWWKYLAAYW